jgi:hypothetical protein
MKRLLFIPILLALCSLVWGQEIIVIKKKSTCDPASNEIGDRGTFVTSATFTPTDKAYCTLHTADCSGTLEYVYLWHDGSGSDDAKTCVYADNGDNVPNSGDTQVGNCVAQHSNASETDISASKVTGSVTSGNKYWVCTVADTTEWVTMRESATNTLYVNTSFSYASPPVNLDGTWTPTADRNYMRYVRIE